MIMFGLIYRTASLYIKYLLRLFFVRANSCLKLNVAAVLGRGGGRSPVPPAITPNHGPMNRML